MQKYDYIIAGGGMAGLSLAYHMALSPLSTSNILVIDSAKKVSNDRTWCYWTNKAHVFDSIAAKTWNFLQYTGQDWQKKIDLLDYRYQMVRGIDFYNTVYAELDKHASIDFFYGNIDSIEDIEDGAVVRIGKESFSASFVFDSTFTASEFKVDEQKYHFLKQHFVGWVIEAEEGTFEPDAATFFDFRTPQQNEMRFMYILPESSSKALVEFTLFSYRLLERNEYEDAIRNYLRDVMRITDYNIIHTENGIIPMTDQPFHRKQGKHILRIGTKGGRVKASTGFAFYRTNQDSQNIVSSLINNHHPFSLPKQPWRYGLFDSMLLQILYRKGELAEPVFTRLFQRNPIDRLFRFLDEEGSLFENLLLMKTTVWRYFLSAWLKLKVCREV